MQVPTSNGSFIQSPVAFLPETSTLTGTPRRLDKSDKLEVILLSLFYKQISLWMLTAVSQLQALQPGITCIDSVKVWRVDNHQSNVFSF